MLDAYIIERIRKQREERRDGASAPMRIEVPQEQPSAPAHQPDRDEDDSDRGSVIIDFHV